MNRGLSDKLLKAFPNTVNVPIFHFDSKISNPNWLAGFTSGEGSFGIVLNKTLNQRGGFVLLSFSLSQHISDESLMKNLVSAPLSQGNSYIYVWIRGGATRG